VRHSRGPFTVFTSAFLLTSTDLAHRPPSAAAAELAILQCAVFALHSLYFTLALTVLLASADAAELAILQCHVWLVTAAQPLGGM